MDSWQVGLCKSGIDAFLTLAVQSLSYGRPPSIIFDTTDCIIPEDLEEKRDETGKIIQRSCGYTHAARIRILTGVHSPGL